MSDLVKRPESLNPLLNPQKPRKAVGMNLVDDTRYRHDAIAQEVGVPADWAPDSTSFEVGHQPFVQAWDEARRLRAPAVDGTRQAEAYKRAVTKLEHLWADLRDRVRDQEV
ncbi:hypothetical protein ACIO3O_37970 [Streptomyces sp. NPDC087440]|uniref:hypothetical protein n=1 Tax=Streptomyces sp. NPDC087440 TaxID=3365790 RepID=UPI00380695C9